jgi:hypothetical protein
MDRLLCGDVGFGKTEVALRAAMKAVVDAKQVAVLVPTTVLALQHFKTFKTRFADYPVKIASSAASPRPPKPRPSSKTSKTAASTSPSAPTACSPRTSKFADLGLLVLDEEHRFGVRHKGAPQEMRTDVDVLTMTATPIPRTLQLSLSGMRDLSVITTPPSDRQSVRTYVCRATDEVVRDAILRELSRGGQVFFVHNRVQSIDARKAWLTALVPEARIVVGHGQMDPSSSNGSCSTSPKASFNVLLSTTIIESGIDIPNANTMLVDHADRFGLAQLYQLRGRVGRSRERGYCYLLVASEATSVRRCPRPPRRHPEVHRAGQRLPRRQPRPGASAAPARPQGAARDDAAAALLQAARRRSHGRGGLRPLGRIGESTITLGDLGEFLARQSRLERARYASPEARRALLDDMVRMEVLAREGQRQGLDQAPTVRMAFKRALAEALLDREAGGALSVGAITDEEVAHWYASHRADYARPETREAVLVMVDDEAGAKAIHAKIAEALAQSPEHARAVAGGLALEESIDNRSRNAKGELGAFDRGGKSLDGQLRVAPEIVTQAFTVAEAPALAPVVELDNGGWSVLLVTAAAPAGDAPLDEVRVQIQGELLAARREKARQALVDRLRAQADVSIDAKALEALGGPTGAASAKKRIQFNGTALRREILRQPTPGELVAPGSGSLQLSPEEVQRKMREQRERGQSSGGGGGTK